MKNIYISAPQIYAALLEASLQSVHLVKKLKHGAYIDGRGDLVLWLNNGEFDFSLYSHQKLLLSSAKEIVNSYFTGEEMDMIFSRVMI